MTSFAAPLPRENDAAAHAYDATLRWAIFTGVSLFALAVLRQYGLIRLMVAADRTHITLVIAALYALASLHCLYETLIVGREAAALAALRRDPRAALARPGRARVLDHVRALGLKAARRGRGRLDQTLLLYALSARLQAGLRFGALMGEILMKLGLLGTVVGFIYMLGPVARLDAGHPEAAQAAMAVMGQGMAVAMYATLAGLVGALLLKAQYAFVEAAVADALGGLTRLTETRIVPALERGDG